MIKSQLDVSTSTVHPLLAKINVWVIPKQAKGRQYRKDNYSVPSESEPNTEEDIVFSKFIKKYRIRTILILKMVLHWWNCPKG